VSPRTAFRQYRRTNSSLTVGVTQPACLHLDGANSQNSLEHLEHPVRRQPTIFLTFWWRNASLTYTVSNIDKTALYATTGGELIQRIANWYSVL